MQAAVQLDPHNAANQLALAPLLMRTGDRTGALVAVDAAISLSRTADALVAKSNILQGDPAKAEAAAREALAVDPTHVPAHLRLSWLLQHGASVPGGRVAEATLRSLVRVDPVAGRSRLYDFAHRRAQLEAAIAHRDARLAAATAVAGASPPPATAIEAEMAD